MSAFLAETEALRNFRRRGITDREGVVFAPLPQPASITLFGLGFAGALAARRRRG